MLDAHLIQLPQTTHQHGHEHHQLVIGVEGEAELSVDGAGSRIDVWGACLVPTGARHDFRGNRHNHVLVINLDPYLPALNSPHHGDYERLAPLFERPRTLNIDSQLQGFVQLCAVEFKNMPDNDGLRRHLSAGILHCLADRLKKKGGRKPSRGNSLSPETIRRYIMENLHRKITVKDLAAIACLSVSRFYELFQELVGVTPHQFVIQIRLEQAVQLLTATSLPVSEISYRTGFYSQSALTSALKKYRAITPSKLRSEARS